MKKLKLFLLLPVLIIGILFYFWNPWQVRPEKTNFQNAAETIKAAREAASGVKNYKYRTNVSIGDQVKYGTLTRVVRKDREQMVDIDWDIPKMSGSASIYAKGEELYVFHPLKNKWTLPEEDRTLKPFIDFFWKQLKLVDPVENIIRTEPSGKNISFYEPANEPNDEPANESSEGGGSAGKKNTRAIRVIPDEEALSEIRKSLPPQFIGAELKDISQIFWFSAEDLMVTRYEVRAAVSFFGVKSMDFLVVSEPFDFNKTKIELPKGLVDKMNQGSAAK
ncbi:MAG: hypothetical protein CVU89_09705 [Firmicutes bacterium HGW-Firmicutes-14]|jgi:hypothetical protein|nr:MAG: hypothetical protein CVU89_09705 [Firmicutes bacterium HGW-Firmicutes-14]